MSRSDAEALIAEVGDCAVRLTAAAVAEVVAEVVERTANSGGSITHAGGPAADQTEEEREETEEQEAAA